MLPFYTVSNNADSVLRVPSLQLCYLRGGQALGIRWEAVVLIHEVHFLLGKTKAFGLGITAALSLLLEHPQHTLSDFRNSLGYLHAHQETGTLL